MNDGASNRWRNRSSVAMVIVILASMLAIGISGRNGDASAQASDTCGPVAIWNVSVSWGALERYLAAPAASPETVDALAPLIRQVYRSDGSMDWIALDGLMTPALREAAGWDCSGEPAPAPLATPLPEADQGYLDQARQVDPNTVFAFIVFPGRAMRALPGATPASEILDASMPIEGTPLPGTEITDGIVMVVFVQRDGQWTIDLLTGTTVRISDLVIDDGNGPPRGGIMLDVRTVRESGLPEFPPEVKQVGTPAASPES